VSTGRTTYQESEPDGNQEAAKRQEAPKPRRLPKKLALIRKRLGLSQGDMVTALKLAKRYNRVSISGQERGEREPPLPVILKYAQLVGITTDYLIDNKLNLPD
jgi:transcriptional regulator with XRE-family HTH domain